MPYFDILYHLKSFRWTQNRRNFYSIL